MTQAVSIGTVWTRQEYLDKVLAALSDEDGDFNYEDPKGAIAEIPELQRIDFESTDGRVLIRVGEAHPGNAQLTIFGLFPGDEQLDVLIYAFPNVAVDPNEKRWLRYATNRMNGQVAQLLYGMTREVFVRELAAEYDSLLDDGEEETPDPQEGALEVLPPEAPTSPATPIALA
jgi:hypothetical protein